MFSKTITRPAGGFLGLDAAAHRCAPGAISQVIFASRLALVTVIPLTDGVLMRKSQGSIPHVWKGASKWYLSPKWIIWGLQETLQEFRTLNDRSHSVQLGWAPLAIAGHRTRDKLIVRPGVPKLLAEPDPRCEPNKTTHNQLLRCFGGTTSEVSGPPTTPPYIRRQ